MAKKEALRELQSRLAERLQAARTQQRGSSWLAVEVAGRGILFPLKEAGEIFALAPLVPAGVLRFRQQRPLGLGFLRGLLSERHLTDAGLDPAAFWADAERRCAGATAAQLQGTHDWALLHHARRPGQARAFKVAACEVQAIGCSAPP